MSRLIPEPATWPDAVHVVPESSVIRNGLLVQVARRPDVPLVEIRLVVPLHRAGATWSPGNAAVLNALVGYATVHRRADEVQQQLADDGGGLEVSLSADSDALVLAAYCPGKSLSSVLLLLAELVLHPDLRDTAGARTAAASAATSAVDLHDDLLTALLTGRKRGPDPLPVVRPELLGPEGSTLLLVGDVDLATVLAAAGPFEQWTGREAVPVAGEPLVVTDGITLADRPGDAQAVVGYAGLIPRDSPAVVLAAGIVGGPATSRLSVRLRERRGWAYWAHAHITHTAAGSRVVARTAVPAGVGAAALNEIRYELARAATVLPTEDEVRTAARYAAGRVAIELHTARGHADALAADAAAGRAWHARADLAAALREVTPEQVRAAALEHLAPTRLHAVAVGPADLIGPALGALAAVRPWT